MKKHFKSAVKAHALTILLALLLSFGLSACSVANAEEPINLMRNVHAHKVQIETENAEKFRKDVFDFSTELFKRSLGEESSLISPLSVTMALAMTANGASGSTRTQAEELLGDLGTLNAGFYLYMNRADPQAKLANSIWIKNTPDFDVKRDFLETNATYYGADAYLAPFDTNTVDDINGWVSKNTDGMIKKLLNDLNPDAMMCLISTVLFKAEWQEPFSHSAIETFYNIKGEEEKAEMLKGNGQFFLEGENAVGYIKSYKNEKYSFIALLPDENITVSEFIETMSADTLINIIDNKISTPVQVTMPKFSYDYSISLADILAEMGWSDAFNASACFDRISDTHLYISDVIHKSHIELDKDGTEAAAASAVILSKTQSIINPTTPIILTFDRPFVYIIYDNDAGLPLFMGTLNTTK